MKKGFLSFLITILLSVTASANPVGQELVDSVLKNGLVVNPELDAQGVRKQLGEPINETTEFVENKYLKQKDKIQNLTYTNLKILIYTSTLPEHSWSKVSQVTVSGNSYGIPIKIGMSKIKISQLLGVPSSISNSNAWYYFPSDEEPHLQLIIKFESDVVSEVTWSFMP